MILTKKEISVNMNDPNKAINVNLSSLLSLKAELLRKQSEVNKARKRNILSAKDQEYTSHKSSSRKSNEYYEDTNSSKEKGRKKLSRKNDRTDDAQIGEQKDSAILEKSKKVLETKAKFYEQMQKTGGSLNYDDNCLVMFNKKKQEINTQSKNNLEIICGLSENTSSSENDDCGYPDDGQYGRVEYIDCLGRTRTCLKSDLAEAKRKDEKLAASIPERLDQTKANWMIDIVGSQRESVVENDDDNSDMIETLAPTIFGDGLSIISKLEEQKVNWERKEHENLEKTDVHYQDVFFDEARQHGVGYYAFSTDEKERRKQQRDLEKARQQTLEEQKREELLKKQRGKIIAERVLAAKNRQRVRLGLPPLEKEDNENKDNLKKKVPETKEERKERKKAEKLKKKKLKEDQDRETERLNHIRPWDKEKDDVAQNNSNNEIEDEWQYKPEREPMTQEQWNEFKRNERINEFARPITVLEHSYKRTNFNNTAISKTKYTNIPPAKIIGFSKYQSTKTSKSLKRRYCYETAQQLEEDIPTFSSYSKAGNCIPPPANLADLHLPSNKRCKSSYELEKSIEAGLRFLRNNSDKDVYSTKSSWTSKANY